MSKVGKQPITLPEGVSIEIKGRVIEVKGPKGNLEVLNLNNVGVEIGEKEINCVLKGKNKQSKSNWGTQRSILGNAVKGVSEGFEKVLIIEGVGYRVSKEKKNLVMQLGFSHPVKYSAPEGIEFEIEKNSIVKVKGINKELVGQVAAEIRSFRKPEPYKGTGIRYDDEIVQRKQGKKTATSS